MKKILIVKLGSAPRKISSLMGDYDRWISEGLGAEGRRVEVVSPPDGEELPAPDTLSGVVLTGSDSMVTSREEWSERTARWLRGVTEEETPILGICYGHQLLAHASGGVVGDNPKGEELGTVAIDLLQAASEDPLLGSLEKSFVAQAAHTQSVLSLPSGAVLLAKNPHDPHQAYRLGKCAWGVQFHPEFPPEATRAFIEESAEKMRAEGRDPDKALEDLRDTPEARKILRIFGELVQNRLYQA